MRQCDRIGCHAFENENIFHETFVGVWQRYICAAHNAIVSIIIVLQYIFAALYVTLHEAVRGIKRRHCGRGEKRIRIYNAFSGRKLVMSSDQEGRR